MNRKHNWVVVMPPISVEIEGETIGTIDSKWKCTVCGREEYSTLKPLPLLGKTCDQVVMEEALG